MGLSNEASVIRSVLVADDEGPARLNLALALAEYPQWALVAQCANAAEVRAALAVRSVDLVLLDIRMPGGSGLDLAHELCRLPEPPLIVFITAYDAFAVQAFDAYAIDYLLKPFDDARFARMLERAAGILDGSFRQQMSLCVREAAEDTERHLRGAAPQPLSGFTVRSTRKVERILLDDVVWIESAGNYVNLHLNARSVLHRATMAWVQERLPPDRFLRVHRTAMVRIEQLALLRSIGSEKYRLRLRNGAEVPVSAKLAPMVRNLLRQE